MCATHTLRHTNTYCGSVGIVPLVSRKLAAKLARARLRAAFLSALRSQAITYFETSLLAMFRHRTEERTEERSPFAVLCI